MSSNLEKLEKMLLEDPNVQNNINAATQLASVQERDKAIDLLRRGFEIVNPNLHLALIDSLIKHRAKEALAELAGCLKSPNATVRNKAADALVEESIRGPEVVDIFKDRFRYERDQTAKIYLIQKCADLPYPETVDLLLDLLRRDGYRTSPLVEPLRSSLTSLAKLSPKKLIDELASPLADEIKAILANVDMDASPGVWQVLLEALADESEPKCEGVKHVIVNQLSTKWDNDRAMSLINLVTNPESPGVVKDRALAIVDALSESQHGKKLIRPVLELLKRKSEDMIKRQSWVDALELDIKHFDVARDYMDEVTQCYVQGFLRPSIILSMSALESAIKNDYIRNVATRQKQTEEEAEKFAREIRFYTLLNRYFTKRDIGRLPKEYQDFSNTEVKIRNSLIHPEEFQFSEPTARNVLTNVSELIKHLESLQGK